jgi:peptide chain release factor subunit 1
MITYPDIEDLLDFQSKKQPIISFYLNTDRSRFTLDQQRVTARNLLREGRKTVEAGSWKEEQRACILKDFDHLQKFLNDELEPTFKHRGVAIFSCSDANLWRMFGLPRAVPSNLLLEPAPHVRPLTLILDEYHRFGVLVLDKKRAELHEIYIGEIINLERPFAPTISGSFSLSPIEGPGSLDRGISRREEEGTQKHFRNMAERLFHLYHRRHWEYLVLGGQQQILTQFENFLHPTLKGKLVAHFAAEPGKTRQSKILEEVSAIERRVEIEKEKKLIKELVNSAKSRGLAVIGLEEVLTALQMGAVHQLLVQEDWHTPGVICRNCGLFGIEKDTCPGCGSVPTHVADMVDEVIETAIRTGSIIEHVHPESGLEKHGNIGAILRFRV